uniref:Uncharacterized protein n=1 Tax=Saccharum officinarum TaxID=4547 RepID=A0A678THR7_SACOF|nr:hypothetical protein SO89O17_000003 [Saccharum officinarum]
MSGIKNSMPAQRVTAPGEQGQVAHPHSAGSTPGPTKGAFLPLDGRPARLRLVRRLPALIDAARGVAWRVDGVTDVYFTMAVQSTACSAPVPDALCVRGSSVRRLRQSKQTVSSFCSRCQIGSGNWNGEFSVDFKGLITHPHC